MTNVELVEADVASYTPAEPVDAVLGRLVLSYLPDPVGTIRRQLGALDRVGSTWRSEYDTEAVRNAPQTPLVARLADLLNGAFAARSAPRRRWGRTWRGCCARPVPRMPRAWGCRPTCRRTTAVGDPTGPAMLAA